MTKDKKHRVDQAKEKGEEEIIEGEIVDEGIAPGSEAPEGGAIIDEHVVPVDQYNALAEELQQAQAKAKEYFEGWQRERADFANYKRRVERDREAMVQDIKGGIIKRFLPVLDDLERALKAKPTDGTASSWANGIELIYRKLQNILESEGVQRIPAETEEFNPTRHEAITHEDSPEHESGQIIEVVQQGYTLGDRILRPALVRVAR